MSKYCSQCGTEINNESSFCSKCGTRLDSSPEIDKYKPLLDDAIEDRRWKDVSKYSDVTFIDENDYKSIFFIELAEYWITDLHNLDEGQCIIDAYAEAINILNEKNNNEIGSIIINYSDEIYNLIESIISKTRTFYGKVIAQTFEPYNPIYEKLDARTLYLNTLVLCINLLNTIIDYYNKYKEEIENDEKLKIENFDFVLNLLIFLKEKNNFISIINTLTDYNEGKFLEMEESTTEEIKKYDSSYSLEDDYNNDFCENCGKEVSSEDEFCPNCGESLVGLNYRINEVNNKSEDEKFSLLNWIIVFITIVIILIFGGIFLLPYLSQF